MSCSVIFKYPRLLYASSLRIFLVFLSFNIFLEATEESKETASIDLTQACLFVSHITRVNDIRTASFPFDWIVSMDGERFIEILDNDFLHFFSNDFLVTDDQFSENIYNVPVNGDILLNTYYHLEFLHEPGNWKTQFSSTMQTFRDRYERRINRFRNLRNFPGKVYFMRSAHVATDSFRFFRYEENTDYFHELIGEKSVLPNECINLY